MTKKYQHIFWDLDHTLWDFEANSKNTIALIYDEFELGNLGINDFESFNKVYEIYNEQLWVQLRAGAITRELLRWKRMDLSLQEFGIKDEELAHKMSERYLELLPTQSILMPEANNILQYCQERGYIAHIITNGFETTQWIKLNNSGIKHYFVNMFTSEQAQAMKPNATIFKHALEKANADIKSSVMIGDCLDADMLGARNFGLDHIFYNPNNIKHNDPVTYEINCLSQLKSIL